MQPLLRSVGVEVCIISMSHISSGEMSERLLDHLRKLGARRLYFAGALTKACVMFSANSAFNLGFEARKNSIFIYSRLGSSKSDKSY